MWQHGQGRYFPHLASPPPTFQHLRQVGKLALRSKGQEEGCSSHTQESRSCPSCEQHNRVNPIGRVVSESHNIMSVEKLSPLFICHVAACRRERPEVISPSLPTTPEARGRAVPEVIRAGVLAPPPLLQHSVEWPLLRAWALQQR